MQQFDVVTIGDALIDHFLKIHGTSKFCEVKPETHQVCFLSGSKIMVDDSEFALGGNASNVAVGSSRLGFRTAIIAEIGDDEFSQKITNGLKQDNVDMTYLKKTANTPSTFSISLSFMGDRTNFVHHVERMHDIDFSDAEIALMYLTSLGKEWKTLYQRVIDYKKTHDTVLAFNPGSAQLQEGRESFKNVLSICDILIVNKEEAEEIVYGAIQHTENQATQADVLMQELQKLGSKMVCLTDGLNGSYVIDPEGKVYHQEILPATIVEKTGAGDAFSTGFLGALLLDNDIPTSMRWGAGNSASVIERVGAQKGLLTKKELEKRVES